MPSLSSGTPRCMSSCCTMSDNFLSLWSRGTDSRPSEVFMRFGPRCLFDWEGMTCLIMSQLSAWRSGRRLGGTLRIEGVSWIALPRLRFRTRMPLKMPLAGTTALTWMAMTPLACCSPSSSGNSSSPMKPQPSSMGLPVTGETHSSSATWNSSGLSASTRLPASSPISICRRATILRGLGSAPKSPSASISRCSACCEGARTKDHNTFRSFPNPSRPAASVIFLATRWPGSLRSVALSRITSGTIFAPDFMPFKFGKGDCSHSRRPSKIISRKDLFGLAFPEERTVCESGMPAFNGPEPEAGGHTSTSPIVGRCSWPSRCVQPRLCNRTSCPDK
mmetsp:Transcript_26739/g.75099  ORF Transcript_26739/g.75099 Transcript_26739/m.75099 type:complete len:334 (-) Transcript_26739:357-1358(-)